MNKEDKLYKLSQGTYTAVWAHDEIIKQDKRIAELEKERAVRDLEQQAKGVEYFIKSEAENLQNAPWFQGSIPTLEYLYDVDFGISTCCRRSVDFSKQLRNKAKALKEQGE
jgi:hypothetical protein